MLPPELIGDNLIGKTISKVENHRHDTDYYWEIALTFTDNTYILWRCNKPHKDINDDRI